jgi:glycerophosphoryl diester phosphodiesterase
VRARPLVVAHRGASHGAPDNTKAAFELAIAEGADLLETDVRETRDGVLVLHHDATLADGRPLEACSLREAREAVPGLLRLDELCLLAAGRCSLDVELKTAGQEERALAILDAHLPGWEAASVVTSFLEDVVVEVRRRRPGARVGLLVDEVRDDGEGGPVARALAVGAQLLAAEDGLVDADLLVAATHAGLPLVVWTVDAEQRAQDLAGRPVVEMIITNRPAAIRAAIGTTADGRGRSG